MKPQRKAVLDWEMTTLGHPLMDLALGYWIHHTDPDFIAQNQLNLTTQKETQPVVSWLNCMLTKAVKM